MTSGWIQLCFLAASVYIRICCSGSAENTSLSASDTTPPSKWNQETNSGDEVRGQTPMDTTLCTTDTTQELESDPVQTSTPLNTDFPESTSHPGVDKFHTTNRVKTQSTFRPDTDSIGIIQSNQTTKEVDSAVNFYDVTTEYLKDTSSINETFATTQKSDGRTSKPTLQGSKKKGRQNKNKISSYGIVSSFDLTVALPVLDMLTYPIFSLSIILNTVNVIVYQQPAMRNPVCTLIVGGNVFDVLANAVGLTKEILTSPGTTFRSIVNSVMLALNHCSGCMMCLVAIERCCSMVNPLKRSRISRHQKLIITLVTLLVLVFDVPGMSNSYVDNDTVSKVLLIVLLISKVLFVYVGLMIMLICNIVTAIALKIQDRKRSRMTGSSRPADRQTTKILLIMTLLYILLSLPKTIVSMMHDVSPDFQPAGKEVNFTKLMFHVSNLMSSIVNLSDFIVFYLLSTKFRFAVVTMICRCSQRKTEQENVLEVKVLN